MEYYRNTENVKLASFVEKSDTNWLGILVGEEKFDFRNKRGPIELLIAKENASESEIDFARINLGQNWLFIFAELIEIYNKRDVLDNVIKFWTLGKQKEINNGNYYIFTIYYNKGSEPTINIKEKNGKTEKTFVMYFKYSQLYSLVRKIVAASRKIVNFNFTLNNINSPEDKLIIKRSDKHKSTLFCIRNGIMLPDVFLCESDKRLLQYSCESRLFYNEWLSVHGEKINISRKMLLTTIDAEFILDKENEVNGSFVALVILCGLYFNTERNK
jgi:hypothetical protein